MRTEGSRSSASGTARLRHELTRARTWLRGRGRMTRLALVAAAGAALVATAFLAIPTDRDEPVWLYDRPFSGDAALAIRKALATEKIPFRSDAAHRIGVAASRWGDAMARAGEARRRPGLARRDRERPPVAEPLDRPGREARAGPLADRAPAQGDDRGLRRRHPLGQRLDPPAQVREGMRPEWKSSGLVILDVERRPSHKVVCSIQTLLARSVPGLSPDAVTVGDRSGNFFLEAGNPRRRLGHEGPRPRRGAARRPPGEARPARPGDRPRRHRRARPRRPRPPP